MFAPWNSWCIGPHFLCYGSRTAPLARRRACLEWMSLRRWRTQRLRRHLCEKKTTKSDEDSFCLDDHGRWKKTKEKKQQVFFQKGRLLFLTFFHHLGGFETNPRVTFSITFFLWFISPTERVSHRRENNNKTKTQKWRRIIFISLTESESVRNKYKSMKRRPLIPQKLVFSS